MQMNDKKLIIAGVVIFVAVVAFPFWFNMGKAAPAPELELTDKAKAKSREMRHADGLHEVRAHAVAGPLAAFGR
jgi:hypothetical protein